MRFSITIITATLAALCAADRMVTSRSCSTGTDFKRCFYSGEYIVNSGRKFTFDDDWGGCKTRNIPEMAEFCIDFGKSRAHFRFNHQHKRCLKVTARGPGTRSEWSETRCNWRRDEDGAEEVDGVSENLMPAAEERE